KLCLLIPDLIKLDMLRSYLETDQLWECLAPVSTSNETLLTELSSGFINILIRNQWIEELPLWWTQIYNTDTNTIQIRIFFMACCLGHTKVARSLLTDTFSPDYDTRSATFFALNFASNYGNSDAVEYLLSLPFVDPAPQFNRPLKNALNTGHIDIVKMLLKRCHSQSGQRRVKRGFEDIFLHVCYEGTVDALEILLGLPEYFPTSPGNGWRFRGMIAAVGRDRVEIVRLLLESGKGFDTREICDYSMMLAVGNGQLEMVRILAAQEGADIAKAQVIALNNGHTMVADVLSGYLK
ncbi:hypothetical protein HDU76_001035, partial [Blyttiomyces sp. JEL0837]